MYTALEKLTGALVNLCENKSEFYETLLALCITLYPLYQFPLWVIEEVKVMSLLNK